MRISVFRRWKAESRKPLRVNGTAALPPTDINWKKVHGTRNDYRLVEQENYLLLDGLHEDIVSEDLWHEAQVKLLAQAKKYEKVNNGKDNKVHLLTGLLKCHICGAGMYGNKSIKRKADLDDRLYKMYDKIEDTENLLIEARAKKMAIEAEKLTADNIYKVLIYFEKPYAVMDEQEKRQIMEWLISEIHIYEERQPNGQWLKSIKFKLPIIEEDMEMSLDNDSHVESVVLMTRVAPTK